MHKMASVVDQDKLAEFADWREALIEEDDNLFSEDEDEGDLEPASTDEQQHSFMNISRPPQAASAMLFYMSYYAIIYHPWISDRIVMNQSYVDDFQTGKCLSFNPSITHIPCSVGFCSIWGNTLVECPECEGHLFCNKPVLDPSTGTYVLHSDHDIHIPRLIKMHQVRTASTTKRKTPYGMCQDQKTTNPSLRCERGALFGWTFCEEHLSIRKRLGQKMEMMSIQENDINVKAISKTGPHEDDYDAFFGMSDSTDRMEFPTFHHLYCYLKKQIPGLSACPLPAGYAKRLAFFGSSHYDMPPSLNVGLFQGSPLVDSWFSLPHNVLETVKKLSTIHLKYNTANRCISKDLENAKQRPSIFCNMLPQDPQMPNWTLLHAILERARCSPIVRVDLKPETIAQNNDTNTEELVNLGQCFTRVPDHCPISPQMGDDGLCCVRFGGAYTDKNSLFPLGSYIFISQKYGKYIEAYWNCYMIDKVVACKVFDWCSSETIAMGNAMDIDKALTKCYKLLVPQFVDYWTKHLVRLNTFFQFVTKTKDYTWNVLYSSSK